MSNSSKSPSGISQQVQKQPRLWVLTDGKAGDELQCLGVAEGLSDQIELRRIHPRLLWSWLAPYGPIDPKEKENQPNSPLKPPFPDCVIASGRRAVPYLRYIRQRSPQTFTVFLKDPRTGSHAADLIWVPEHDRLRAENVLTTITPPHRLSPEKITEARRSPDNRLSFLASPRVAVLVGGTSRHHKFTSSDTKRFTQQLHALIDAGAHLMITASRRTPQELREAITALTGTQQEHFFWDGQGDNPYFSMLSLADYVVATADSFNMIGEAAATGKPILVFEPSGGHPKLSAFLKALETYGAVHPFTGRLEGTPYVPLDATQRIANRIAEEMRHHNNRLNAS